MIDLVQMVDVFLDEAVNLQIRDCQGKDATVIRVLNNRNRDAEAGEQQILSWLKYYQVLQGLNGADRLSVVRAILEFADENDLTTNLRTEGEIIEKFRILCDRCSSKVRPKKNGDPRDFTSLTSKALWCCYPHAVPLFDSHVERTLWVISRLIRLPQPAADAQRYNRFLAVWRILYDRVENTMDINRLRGYPYKVRVFDKILWIIGQPKFGV